MEMKHEKSERKKNTRGSTFDLFITSTFRVNVELKSSQFAQISYTCIFPVFFFYSISHLPIEIVFVHMNHAFTFHLNSYVNHVVFSKFIRNSFFLFFVRKPFPSFSFSLIFCDIFSFHFLIEVRSSVVVRFVSFNLF